MMIALHKNARTTPALRAEMAASSETAAAVAQRYGVFTPLLRLLVSNEVLYVD